MRYAGIIKNDITSAPGVCLTFFVQGCAQHCLDCHNPETWDFNGGKEFTQDTLTSIIHGLRDNGVKRNFCVMGGEPLADENLFLTLMVIKEVKNTYPDIKIYLWTGLLYEDLLKKTLTNPKIKEIFDIIDVIIDGPFIKEQRDVTLFMRGSKNQRVIELRE